MNNSQELPVRAPDHEIHVRGGIDGNLKIKLSYFSTKTYVVTSL